MSDEMLEYTPEQLEALGDEISDLRAKALFNVELHGAEALSETHYLQAIACLEMARLEMKKAQFLQSRALVN